MAAFLTAIGTALGFSGTAAATTVGIGVTAAGAFGASKLLSSALPKAPKPTTPQAIPKEAVPSVDKAAAAAKTKLDDRKRAIARNRTQFTGPLGLSEEDKSSLALKTLTGV